MQEILFKVFRLLWDIGDLCSDGEEVGSQVGILSGLTYVFTTEWSP